MATKDHTPTAGRLFYNGTTENLAGTLGKTTGRSVKIIDLSPAANDTPLFLDPLAGPAPRRATKER